MRCDGAGYQSQQKAKAKKAVKVIAIAETTLFNISYSLISFRRFHVSFSLSDEKKRKAIS